MSVETRDRWIKRLKQEGKAHEEFRKQAEDAQDAYFADTSDTSQTYPLFWSTIKVLHSRIYSQPPKPDVRKRYPDAPGKEGTPPPGQAQTAPPAQPGAAPAPMPGAPPQAPQPPPLTVDDNKIADCIERALTYTIDTTDFDTDGHMSVNDLLVAGLGMAKVELHTETDVAPVINPATGQAILDKDGQPVTQKIIVDQKVKLRAFAWSQFHWEPQQHWSLVTWEAFDHWLTADEIEDQFGVKIKEGARDTFTAGETQSKDSGKPDANKYKTLYCVHEVWDKSTKQRIFVTESHEDTLEEKPDPLGLEGFFPNPAPMMLNVKGEDLVPQPDYTYCQRQFNYINELTGRISALTGQIKDVGFYDAAFPELAGLVKAPDGTMIPINGLIQRLTSINAKAEGFDAIVCKQDNSNKASTVQELLQLRDVAKQEVWEIYGVTDIQRGATDPNETATAQTIKAQWADVRVGERIRTVSLFFRDVFRVMAEIIAEHFKPDVLKKMTGIELNELEMNVLHSDLGRCYAIDIESDSTVVQDEFAQKQQRLEFLNTVTGYIKEIIPALQQGAMPADLAKELLLFAINTFKDGRQLEQVVNSLPTTVAQLAGMQQQIQQGQQQNQQVTKQLQDTQAQLQQVNGQKEQRENVKTGADVQEKAAKTEKTQVETAKLAEETRGQAHENALRQQFPLMQ